MKPFLRRWFCRHEWMKVVDDNDWSIEIGKLCAKCNHYVEMREDKGD